MRIGIILGAALACSACATTYGEIDGWSGDGVSADRLSADTFRIRSRGNGATEAAIIEDFALLRAAEAVKMACFSHFVVLEGADRTQVSEIVTPEQETRRVEEKEVDGKIEKVVTRTYTPASTSIVVRPGRDLIVQGLALAPGQRAPAGAMSADDTLTYVSPRVVRRKNAPPVIFPDCGRA